MPQLFERAREQGFSLPPNNTVDATLLGVKAQTPSLSVLPLAGQSLPVTVLTQLGKGNTPETGKLVWLLFLIGAGFIGICLSIALLLLKFRLRNTVPAEAWIVNLIPGLDHDGLQVLVSEKAIRPYCFGLRKPCIVLPRELCKKELSRRLRFVLLHEQAHIAHGDLRHHGRRAEK